MPGGWNRDQSSARAKLTPDEVREIRRRIENGEGTTAISREFAVSRRTVYSIRTGDSYRWVRSGVDDKERLQNGRLVHPDESREEVSSGIEVVRFPPRVYGGSRSLRPLDSERAYEINEENDI